jgi:hypothetical protein
MDVENFTLYFHISREVSDNITVVNTSIEICTPEQENVRTPNQYPGYMNSEVEWFELVERT